MFSINSATCMFPIGAPHSGWMGVLRLGRWPWAVMAGAKHQQLPNELGFLRSLEEPANTCQQLLAKENRQLATPPLGGPLPHGIRNGLCFAFREGRSDPMSTLDHNHQKA